MNELPFLAAPHPFYYTVDTSFNDNLLDEWAWERPNTQQQRLPVKDNLGLTDAGRAQLTSWVYQQYQAGELAWGNVFSDLAQANAYRSRFFRELPNTVVLSLSFQEKDIQRIRARWQASFTNYSQGGSLEPPWLPSLLRNSNAHHQRIGYDLIGTEPGILGLTSFLVHDIELDLYQRFGIRQNAYGLLDTDTQQEAVMAYMHDPQSRVEPLDWYWAAVDLWS
ncbi:hypothetical protein [Spirosoma fluviale]|uniref:hypothetical protein n=1 Tax=Spirosoma fluviale TaxID=1597977 RepID=UPI001C53B23E|nr:hypothetical protein [Spirosoma fluviale]